MRKSWCCSFLHTLTLLLFFLDHYHAGCDAVRTWKMMSAEMEMVVEVVHPSFVHRRQLQTAPYCVAVQNADQTQLQKALDWACTPGQGNVDCSPLQVGGTCYSPNTLVNHASYAFNQYYISQNAATGSCSFNGVAATTFTNPSYGTCTFPSYNGSTAPTSSNITTALSPSSTFGNTTITETPSLSPSSPIVRPSWLNALCGSILVILFLKI